MTNLETLRCAVRHLLALLDDPHPGDAAWQEAYQIAIEAVEARSIGEPEILQRTLDAEREAIATIYAKCPDGMSYNGDVAESIRARIGQPGALEAARREGREAGLREALSIARGNFYEAEEAAVRIESLISEEQPK